MFILMMKMEGYESLRIHQERTVRWDGQLAQPAGRIWRDEATKSRWRLESSRQEVFAKGGGLPVRHKGIQAVDITKIIRETYISCTG
jgi:hypothetical protein